MALDFTALNRIAYKGFETVEDQERKDKLIDQGITIVSDTKDNPFLQATETASERLSASTLINTTSTHRQASESKRAPLLRPSTGADYNALYRAAHDFHQKHSPPIVGKPEEESVYWIKVTKDVSDAVSACNGDPFLVSLLIAILEELETEYKAMRSAPSTPSALDQTEVN